MSILDLLAELCHLGVTMVIDGEQLRLRAPRGVITDELRASVTIHKREIVEAYGDGVIPDETLPALLRIPMWCPNSLSAVKSCLDSQRVKL
jgi:hypothetical protein